MINQIKRTINYFYMFKHLICTPNCYKTNLIEIDKNLYGNIRLRINGKNNKIHLSNISVNPHVIIDIRVYGNENEISITDAFIGDKLTIVQGQNHPNFGPIKKSIFSVGKNTSIEGLRYITYNSNSKCTIGSNCMLSTDITMFNTDAHPIFSMQTGQLVNFVNGIFIGEHCWLGERCTILKNSTIPNDCIIGFNAIVSGTLKDEHAIYAGNPAKVVKKGFTWNPNGSSCGFIENRQ